MPEQPNTTTEQPILQTREIRVCFGSHCAVESFTHTFKAGAWTHIIGPNGSGKTTLLRTLCGLQSATSGTATLNEKDIASLTPIQRAQTIAYVPQRLESLPAMSVLDFVQQGRYAWFRFETTEAAQKQALEALTELGLASYAHRRLDQLSGGEQQLCVLASALAQHPAILLLDEPTSALDLRHSELICSRLQEKVHSGLTVISTTHDLSQAQRFGDEFILMNQSQCIYRGNVFVPHEILGKAYDIDPAYFDYLTPKHRISAQIPSSEQTEHIRPPFPSAWKTGIILGILCITLLLICPMLGATISGPADAQIFWQLRVPRVLWGCIAGAVLSAVGAVLQSLFHNPLATPYTLGIASGASLGAMIAIQLGLSGIIGLPFVSCIGGISIMVIVLLISSRSGLKQPIYCLLAGIAASMFCSAAGLVVQSFATPLTAQQMMRWQLGGLEVVGYQSLSGVPVIVLALAILYSLHQPVNLLGVDSDLASSRGVCVERTRTLALLATGIATSLVVSICGPIGFIGLIIPNAIRRIHGADLKHLLPLSALCGAGFLMLADTISRILERSAWIPAGVVTSIIGAPIFIYAILHSAKERHS